MTDDRQPSSEAQLRSLIDDVANQLCVAVDGNFDFTVNVGSHDETIEKLGMLLNFVLDSARRSVQEVVAKRREIDLLEASKLAEVQASRAKTEFLANMSHEIRTPMTAILGFAETLLEPDLPESDRIAAVEIIRRNGLYLLAIINDILDLSRVEAGESQIRRSICSPLDLLDGIVVLMQGRTEEKNLSFDVEFEGPIPRMIETDPVRLRQILINLIGNAIKFTHAGGIRLAVGMCDGDDAVTRMQFDVIDTGIGLSYQDREAVFGLFSQGGDPSLMSVGGTGLGLTLSRQLARQLGGDVVIADSSLGSGSRFRATVATGPLEESVFEANPRIRGHVEPPISPPTKGQLGGRVLVAEDGADNRRLIAHVLERAGLDTSFAENGQIAVYVAQASAEEGEPFDVILMDMRMPVMDGYRATELLRENDYDGTIIALTAHAMRGERERCIAAGCDDFVPKPIDRSALLEVLERHLNKGQTG